MSHEGRRGKRKHRAGHGACSYCGKAHKKGKKRGDSCRGHGRMADKK